MSTVQIPLSRGYVALVDAADADAVSAFKWSALVKPRTVYAYRNVYRADGTRTTQSLHRFLAGFPVTDHINGNGLDNRRANLREVTKSENNRNRRRGLDNTSGYKGVTWVKRDHRWQARIHTQQRRLSLGVYRTAEEAARAYDAAARQFYGEYAALNFPQPGEQAA